MRIDFNSAAPWLLAAATLLLGLLAIPPQLPELDAVNFALALERYDLARYQPHFPGYPVYWLVSAGLARLGVGAVWALALPGVLGAAGAALLLARAVRSRSGSVVAVLVVALVAWSPMAVTLAARPLSDGLAASLVVAALAVFLSERPATAGALLGVALGVRPTLLPLVGPLALVLAARGLPAPGLAVTPAPRSSGRRVLAGLTVATGAWLVPFVALIGPRELLAAGTSFLGGHFGRWGGSVATSPLPLAERTAAAASAFAHAGLGADSALGGGALGWAALALLAAGLVALALRAPRALLAGAVALGPYAAFALLAQNPEGVRHLLPVVLGTALGAGFGLAALAPARPWLAGAVAAACLALAAPAAWRQGTLASPAAQLAHAVGERWAPTQLQLLGGPETRLFAYYLPEFRANRVASLSDARRELAAMGGGPRTVLVTSEVAGADTDPGLHLVASFAAPPGSLERPSTLRLYEVMR